jgi:hypothetical protein
MRASLPPVWGTVIDTSNSNCATMLWLRTLPRFSVRP